MTKRQILFIHGGGADAYEADGKLAGSLQTALGPDFEVRYPDMNGAAPEYRAWSVGISGELSVLDGEAILVGHSLGASVLLKYLSEERVDQPISGVFLIAAPYWGTEDWEVEEFELQEDFASALPQDIPVFLYHSRDDEIVPFAHVEPYEAKLPWATVREFNGRGHQFGDDLSEVADDIRKL